MAAVSQSVERAFKVFEVFKEQRRALTALDIIQHINAPRSSAAALLKTLVDLELLSIDRRTTTYFPTAKFAMLGTWLDDGSLFPKALLETLEVLRDKTGETVTLAANQDLHMELVQVVSSGQAISFRAEKGQTFPLFGTGVGTAYLSTLDTQQIKNLYRRAKDRKVMLPNTPTLDAVLHSVELCVEQGFHIAEGAVFKDATAISKATGINVAARPLIVSVTGPTERMKQRFDDISALLIAELSQLTRK